ncbi:MAG: hypothetical protein AAGK17_04340 [Pseudomonadota bacterium]
MIPDIEITLLVIVLMTGIVGLTVNAVTNKIIAFKREKLEHESASWQAIRDELQDLTSALNARGIEAPSPTAMLSADPAKPDAPLFTKEKAKQEA